MGEGGEGLAEGDGDLHGAANRRNIRRTLTWGGVEERVQALQVMMGTVDFGGQLKCVLYDGSVNSHVIAMMDLISRSSNPLKIPVHRATLVRAPNINQQYIQHN